MLRNREISKTEVDCGIKGWQRKRIREMLNNFQNYTNLSNLYNGLKNKSTRYSVVIKAEAKYA